MKQNSKDIIKEILRFLLVGGIATVCDYLVFYLFNNFVLNNLDQALNLFIATTLGFLTGLFVNWFLQRFVYRYLDEEFRKNKSYFLKFLILSLFGLLVTQVGILIASPIYGKFYLTIIVKFDFWKLFMKCLMTCIVLVINYLGRKFFVFKTKNNKKNSVSC